MTIPRAARPRHYAMTAPTFFAVEYAINPWMDTTTTVDTHVAMNQWETLRQTYKELGHTVELVDPRFYHLDTALAVLDDTTIAYYPPAFSAEARRTLLELFPDAIEVAVADANVLGLNVVSDGLNVVMPAAATGFAEQLRAAGFRPIGVDLSELLKGGGSVKCCTLEVHP